MANTAKKGREESPAPSSGKKWNINPDDIKDKTVAKKYNKMYNRAKSIHDQRTSGFEVFSKISHMQSLYTDSVKRRNKNQFSEGSTQAIKRKIRAETIQRVPDGEIKTQYDKNSPEQVLINYIFKNKILHSEYDGRDMMKNLWRTFDAAYDYGFGCVRTGFEMDNDNDYRVTYSLIQWSDIVPAPDCDFIEEAPWYIVREYISRSELKALLDWDTKGEPIKDNTYNEDVVKYLIETHTTTGDDYRSIPLADRKRGITKTESVEVQTLYKRGSKEFVTFVPSCEAVLRKTKNYDPRLDVPIHFMILEPDPDFPLGCSSIMPTLAQQQFADAFQTLSYESLLLAENPPLMVFGNLTNSKIRMRPRSLWAMGTNPNNKIEKFPVETTTLTQYGSILQNISGSMQRNMNITDATVASDAHVSTYSGTPQGVDQQKRDKSVTINQFQKRVEVFFSEWANHAIRSYLAAMKGEQELTVDEETRRRIYDLEQSQKPQPGEEGFEQWESIIHGNKILVDFNVFENDRFEFDVRAGSLIQGEREKEIEAVQQLILPVSQMMSGISEENKGLFEDVLLRLIARLCELSEVDVSQQTADTFNEKLVMDALEATMNKVSEQQQQIEGLQAANGIQPGTVPETPPEGIPPQQGGPEARPPVDVPMPANGEQLPQGIPPQGEPTPSMPPKEAGGSTEPPATEGAGSIPLPPQPPKAQG